MSKTYTHSREQPGVLCEVKWWLLTVSSFLVVLEHRQGHAWTWGKTLSHTPITTLSKRSALQPQTRSSVHSSTDLEREKNDKDQTCHIVLLRSDLHLRLVDVLDHCSAEKQHAVRDLGDPDLPEHQEKHQKKYQKKYQILPEISCSEFGLS